MCLKYPVSTSLFLLIIGVAVGFYFSNNTYIFNAGLISNSINEDTLNLEDILRNNIRVVIVLSLGGTLTLSSLTVLNLVLNGINLGLMFRAIDGDVLGYDGDGCDACCGSWRTLGRT
jgi:uncharacterized membrane protein SpoIIM required for sporulation